METDLHDLARTTSYPPEAFIFVHRGLDFTARQLYGEVPETGESCGTPGPERHVSGQQLCHGLRDYALEQYGLLARSVLKHWHIHKSEDFGHIVFAMVNAGLMRKTDEDSIRDFKNVYDFADVFVPRLQLDEAPGNS